VDTFTIASIRRAGYSSCPRGQAHSRPSGPLETPAIRKHARTSRMRQTNCCGRVRDSNADDGHSHTPLVVVQALHFDPKEAISRPSSTSTEARGLQRRSQQLERQPNQAILHPRGLCPIPIGHRGNAVSGKLFIDHSRQTRRSRSSRPSRGADWSVSQPFGDPARRVGLGTAATGP